jgi:hypothetical protein
MRIRVPGLVCALLAAGTAQAETEPIRIDYQAATECPTAEQFQRQVFERTVSARLARANEPARVFRIRLRRTSGGVSGSLVIEEPDGATMARRVTGDRCRDVAVVLALASALAIDPSAELAPQQSLDGDEQRSDRAKAEPVIEGTSVPDTEFPPDRAGWSVGAMLGPRASFGVGPRPSFGVALGGAAFRRGRPDLSSFGLELAWLQAPTQTVQSASADFRFLVARPSGCPVMTALDASLALGPCVVAELGVVTGRGSEISAARTQNRFWASFEVLLRLDVALGESWFAEAEGGVTLPLTRYRFVFEEPHTTVHPVPAAAGVAALKLGVRY